MAAGDSSWWTSWLSTAKETSIAALTATKRDLSEFVTVLKEDTEAAVTGATASLKGFLNTEDDDENRGTGGRGGGADTTPSAVPIATSRYESQLNDLERNASTFTDPPPDGDGGEGLAEWSQSFAASSHTERISGLLLVKPHLQALHAHLVPSVVSYADFWARYFYHLHRLKQEDERRASLVARATETTVEDLPWDDEEMEENPAIKPKSKQVEPQVMERNHCRKDRSSDEEATISSAELVQPSVQTPELVQPSVQTPELAQPSVQTPELVQPSVQSPELVQPSVQTPELVQPSVQSPELVQPSVQSPELVKSPVQSPECEGELLTPSMVNAGDKPSAGTQAPEKVRDSPPLPGDTLSESSGSFVCIPGDQSPTSLAQLPASQSWQTISTVSEGWEVLPGSAHLSGSDLVSNVGSEVGRVGGDGPPGDSPSEEDPGLQIKALMREMDQECGLKMAAQEDIDGNQGNDWEDWDDN